MRDRETSGGGLRAVHLAAGDLQVAGRRGPGVGDHRSGHHPSVHLDRQPVEDVQVAVPRPGAGTRAHHAAGVDLHAVGASAGLELSEADREGRPAHRIAEVGWVGWVGRMVNVDFSRVRIRARNPNGYEGRTGVCVGVRIGIRVGTADRPADAVIAAAVAGVLVVEQPALVLAALLVAGKSVSVRVGIRIGARGVADAEVALAPAVEPIIAEALVVAFGFDAGRSRVRVRVRVGIRVRSRHQAVVCRSRERVALVVAVADVTHAVPIAVGLVVVWDVLAVVGEVADAVAVYVPRIQATLAGHARVDLVRFAARGEAEGRHDETQGNDDDGGFGLHGLT